MVAMLVSAAPAATVADKPVTVKVKIGKGKLLHFDGVHFVQPVLIKVSSQGKDLGTLAAGEHFADGGWPSVNTVLEVRELPKGSKQIDVTLTPASIDETKISPSTSVTIEKISVP
jgi:hypothetical protein